MLPQPINPDLSGASSRLPPCQRYHPPTVRAPSTNQAPRDGSSLGGIRELRIWPLRLRGVVDPVLVASSPTPHLPPSPSCQRFSSSTPNLTPSQLVNLDPGSGSSH
ncbi:hypothetical protein [Oryza sativa Japonica Group]|uniref:Os01g0529101 protein n=2 Tax=Oryza sativa subsp. japonica TaxID=39947 RepID=Q5QM51_ORYSJ|nr:hypothetical protein [Oryza sativa Japonica Group]BAS72495.1 Os01g0529101 [Oryza sativa Japonica Group]